MKKFERPHPVMVFFNLRSVLFLAVIPVIRGFMTALQGGIARWLSGAWADVLVLLLMLLIATGTWLSMRFRCDGGQIEVWSGLFNRRHTLISLDAVATFAVIAPFSLRPIRALRFRVDTMGGGSKNADFSIFLTPRQAEAILDNISLAADGTLVEVYRPNVRSIVALSLLTSNSFAGILFIATFISQSGKLLGRGFSQTIVGSFEEFSRKLAFGIPPAAAALAYMLIAGWFLGFCLTFVRYKDFTLTRGDKVFYVNGGAFSHRKYFLRYRDINFIDIRRSIFTGLLRLDSLYISIAGYGKQKDDIACIVPAEHRTRFEEVRRKIFPHLSPSPPAFRPERAGITRFLAPAITAVAAISAAILVFLRVFPSWSQFIWFVGLMAYVPSIFFLLIQIMDFRTCGLSFENGSYTIRYSSGLSLHTVVIPEDKVVCVELRQTLLQKHNNYCDIIISSKSEGRSAHRCRNLVITGLSAFMKNRKEL